MNRDLCSNENAPFRSICWVPSCLSTGPIQQISLRCRLFLLETESLQKEKEADNMEVTWASRYCWKVRNLKDMSLWNIYWVLHLSEKSRELSIKLEKKRVPGKKKLMNTTKPMSRHSPNFKGLLETRLDEKYEGHNWIYHHF